MNSVLALEKVLSLPGVGTVLDLGCGDLSHTQAFREAGKEVFSCSLVEPADFVCDYFDLFNGTYDLIWASHVLEHQTNPGLFLSKCLSDLEDDGWLAVTVPPAKDELVGGHVSIWNEGLLLYQLVLAGFDCSEAMVNRYGYNISVIVQKKRFNMPDIDQDFGDIDKLSQYFPVNVKHGDIIKGPINWND